MPSAIRILTDARITAWKAIVQAIQADGRVRAFRPDIRTQGDLSADDAPSPDRVTIDFSPKLEAVEAVAVCYPRRVWRAPVRLSVEVTMPTGLADAESSQQVWAAIEGAVMDRWAANGSPSQPPDIAAFLADLSAAGVFDVEPEVPGDAPEDAQTGVGSFFITCMIEA